MLSSSIGRLRKLELRREWHSSFGALVSLPNRNATYGCKGAFSADKMAESPLCQRTIAANIILLASSLILCALDSTAGQALTPPNFNLAVGRKIEVTATCGVGVTEAELFCKLTGANRDKEDVIGEFEVIQGQLCDYCDRREPSRTHSPEYAVDGTERWWQSPPLSRGLQFNEVNLTIALGQVYLDDPHLLCHIIATRPNCCKVV